MSINHFMNKIKGNISKIDRTIFISFLIILGVASSSFMLGRLSYKEGLSTSKIASDSDNREELASSSPDDLKSDLNEKVYVASRNGKLYYPILCSGANRIKEENKVWFANDIEAQKSGYTLSSTCK